MTTFSSDMFFLRPYCIRIYADCNVLFSSELIWHLAGALNIFEEWKDRLSLNSITWVYNYLLVLCRLYILVNQGSWFPPVDNTSNVVQVTLNYVLLSRYTMWIVWKWDAWLTSQMWGLYSGNTCSGRMKLNIHYNTVQTSYTF